MQVLNEEKQIGLTLEELGQLEPAGHEVIIVDGGSTDGCRSISHVSCRRTYLLRVVPHRSGNYPCAGSSKADLFGQIVWRRTVQHAEAAGAMILQSGKGRALQMNRGAQEATGDILCFLHADSKPPRYFRSSKYSGCLSCAL